MHQRNKIRSALRLSQVALATGLCLFLRGQPAFGQTRAGSGPSSAPAASGQVAATEPLPKGGTVVHLSPRDSDLMIARYNYTITTKNSKGHPVSDTYVGYPLCQAPCGYPIPAGVEVFVQSATHPSMTQSALFELPVGSDPISLRVYRGSHARQIVTLITGPMSFVAQGVSFFTFLGLATNPSESQINPMVPAIAFGVSVGLGIICISTALSAKTRVYNKVTGQRLAALSVGSLGRVQFSSAGLRF